MADQPQDTQTTPADPPQDAAYWQAEAKKAFAARDEERAKRRDLEGRALSKDEIAEFERLRTIATKQEEERKRQAGDFEAWRAQIAKQHEETLAKERTRAEQATAHVRDLVIANAFATATDWFGPDGRTVLPPDVAAAYFAKHVEVQTDDTGPHVVVRDPTSGQVLSDANGPLPFGVAIGKVIEALPTKDRVLRGSGKTGSGSAGGRTDRVPVPDLHALVERAKAGDKAAIETLRERQKALVGGLMGRAYS
jgi:hypothetical protein